MRGVELMGGEPIERIGADTVLLKSGIELTADVVCATRPALALHTPFLVLIATHARSSPGARYKCVGVMPNTDMLKESPFAQKFGFRNSIEVNDHLQVTSSASPCSVECLQLSVCPLAQVEGHPRVYCVGDMMSHKSRELKLGHTAEVNAHLAAHNILNAVAGKPLLRYPNGVTGADSTPKIWCLSLGRYDACLGFNGLVLSGWWVAVMKWMLEWTKVTLTEHLTLTK